MILFNAGISSVFETYLDHLTDNYLQKGVALENIPDYQREVIALILCLFDGINSEGGPRIKAVMSRLNAKPGPLRSNELDWKCEIGKHFSELSATYKKGTKPSSAEPEPPQQDDKAEEVATPADDQGSSSRSPALTAKVVKPRPIKVNPTEVITAPAPVKELVKANRTLTLDELPQMRHNAQSAIEQFQCIGAEFTLLAKTTKIDDRDSRYAFIQRFKHLLTKLWESQELLRHNLPSDSEILTRFFEGDSLTCLRHWRIHTHDHLLKYLDNIEYALQLLQWSSLLTMLSKITSAKIEIKNLRFNLVPQADFNEYFPINLFSTEGYLLSNHECHVPESITALVDTALAHRQDISTDILYKDAAAVLQTDVAVHLEFLAKLMVQHEEVKSVEEKRVLLDIIGASVGDIGEIVKNSYLKYNAQFLPLMRWRNADAHLSVANNVSDRVGQLKRAIDVCETLQEVLPNRTAPRAKKNFS